MKGILIFSQVRFKLFRQLPFFILAIDVTGNLFV